MGMGQPGTPPKINLSHKSLKELLTLEVKPNRHERRKQKAMRRKKQ